jgi:hypothetical protein
MAKLNNNSLNQLVAESDTTGTLQLQVNSTTGLSINANQAIGVGSTPDYGTAGQVLASAGTGAAATWASTVANATNATNIVGGVAGALPYQTAPGVTGFTAAGTAGQVLTSAGTGTPTWATAATPFSTGDVISSTSTTAHTAPDWLACDSTSYSTSTYSALAATLPNSDFTIETTGYRVPKYVSYVNGIYVATGNGIWTSPDGTTWTRRLFTNNPIFNASGNGTSTIVATTSYGAYTSTDNGVTWTFYPINVSYAFVWVAYGASKFVALSNDGYAYYSSNGITWTACTNTPTTTCTFFKFVGSAFIIGNSDASGSIVASTDGITFTRTGPGGVTFYDVAFGNSIYVAVGFGGPYSATTPTSTWTVRTAGGQTAYSVAYGSTTGQFVSVGNDNGTKTEIYSSTNGTTWSLTASTLTLADARVVKTDGTNYIVLTNNSVYYTSSNGTTWTNNLDYLLRASPNPLGQQAVLEYGGSKWIFCTSSTGAVLTSASGTSWTARLNSTYATQIYNGGTTYLANRAIATNGTLVVLPAYNGVVTTTDNQTFTYRAFNNIASAGTITTSGIAYNGTNKFVAIASTVLSASTYSSPDGVTWTIGSTTFATTPTTIATNGSGTWVAGTDAAYVYSSTDGSTWTQRAITGTTATNVVYTNGYFFVAGNSTASYSADGVTWTNMLDTPWGSTISGSIVLNQKVFIVGSDNSVFVGDTPASSFSQISWKGNVPNSGVYAAAYGNGIYVLVGIASYTNGNGLIFYSTDASTFYAAKITQTGNNNTPAIQAITYANGKFIAFGNDNVLYSSADGKSWAVTLLGTSPTSSTARIITYVGSKYALLGTNIIIPESATTFRTPLIQGPTPAYIKT